MKKWALLLLVPLFAIRAFPQDAPNSKLPRHPNPGRVLKLEEVMRIPIEGEGYFYEGARDIRFDKAGNIYINDSWTSARKAHLLKFSPEGKFLKDLYRQGEGPGEIQSSYDFALIEPEVVLYDSMKRKIVFEDLNGKFKTQINKATSPLDALFGSYGDRLVCSRIIYPPERKTSSLYDIQYPIFFLAKDGQTERELGTIHNQMFYISLSQGGGGMNWDPFEAALGDGRLFINSTQDYRLLVLDLKTGKMAAQWAREYPRVERVSRPGDKEFISRFNVPKRRYESDIAGLLYGDGFLWVRTSTESKDKGVLYDLFDSAGHFVDSVFVNLNGRVLAIAGGFLFASHYESDKSSDVLPALSKYRIAESLGAK